VQYFFRLLFIYSWLVLGLKFRNPQNNCLRAVRYDDSNHLFPPGLGDDGWDSENINYFCVFPKMPEIESSPAAFVETKAPRQSTNISSSAAGTEPISSSTGTQQKTVDLIVLNISPSSQEDVLKSYFETNFGPLLMVEVKRDRKTGASRRFAFIRFKNYKDQLRALGAVKHKIEGQQARLGLPDFRDPSELYLENKCFIGRVNESINKTDLRDFFTQFGEVVEVSFPKKFKGYAFVTFLDEEVAKKCCGNDYVIKGFSICVSKSHGTKKEDQFHQQQQPYHQHHQHQHQHQQHHQQGNWNDNASWNRSGSTDWNSSWFQQQQQQQQARDPWAASSATPQSNYYGSGASNYYGANANRNPLLPANPINPMNVLSMAMGNLMAMNQNSYGVSNN